MLFPISGRSPGPRATRLQRRLLREAAATRAARAATPAVERYDLSLINMFCEYMSRCYLSMFIMLSYASSMFDLHVVVLFYVMFNILELIMEIVPNYPTIQKPNCRQFPELKMTALSDAMKPEKFTGVHFVRWSAKAMIWFTALKIDWVIDYVRPEGVLPDAEQARLGEANNLLRGAILSILADRLFDVYMHIKDAKELWEALNTKFGASDAGSELYIMESFHDFKMVNNRSVVEQAHEIQCIAKELELLKCVLPDRSEERRVGKECRL